MDDAITAVTAEVNALLATLVPSNVRAIDTTIAAHHKYNEKTVYLVTVVYLVS